MSIWRLKSLKIQSLLGFQDLKEWNFGEGLQVIEAPNHTGKTSLTLAVLWALSGNIPSLPRLNLKSFRLTNKHSGSEAEQFCQIELSSNDGRILLIKRVYTGARPDVEKELTTDIDGTQLTGQAAQDRIMSELNLKPGSLEGCGVVLQDHRLGFITGNQNDICEVINDMLGLTVLSQLVPTLEERLSESKDLQKEITAFLASADPLARWEQRDRELQAELQNKENQAIDAGFSRDNLDDPAATALKELASAAHTLNLTPPEAGKTLEGGIQFLRTQLDGLRKTSPLGKELAKIQERRSHIDLWATRASSVRDAYAAINEQISAEAGKGEMDVTQLAKSFADTELAIQQTQGRLEQLEGEKGLLTKVYSHLLGHQDISKCPVCGSGIGIPALMQELKTRIEVQVADELSGLKQSGASLSKEKGATEKRLKSVQDLKEQHRSLCLQISAFQAQISAETFCWPDPVDADDLFLHSEKRPTLLKHLFNVNAGVAKIQEDISALIQQKKDETSRQEEALFQPAEKQITRASEKLLPLISAVGSIEAHGKLRDLAASRKSSFENLRGEAQDMIGHLQKIAKSLAQHEEQAASAAVRSRLPRISDFFKSVARNSDYDGLDIQTSIARDKVAYKIQATSSAIGNLNDAVGHVLSEGDLSAASMALLLGLASGDAHHLGFLLLDDPAQGMDEALQANLALAVSKIDKPKQIIILTHQRTFAEALKQAGAQSSRMHSWRLGRVQDE